MTIDDAIKKEENIAAENQRVVDTGIVFDDVTIDMLYCDDTEVIEEHLANYQQCAEEHRQLAEWLKELKQLREQDPCKNAISRQAAIDAMYELCNTGETLKENPWRDNPHIDAVVETIEQLPPVKPQYTDAEIQKMQELEQTEIQKAYELGKAEEPKVGHWILYDHGLGAKSYQCSVCKGFDRGEKGKYCKWCGTKMVEPQEK